MLMNGIEELSLSLIKKVYDTRTLRQVSGVLESLASNGGFKSHAKEIANKDTLTDGQKRTQILYLLKDVGESNVYNFFSDILAEHKFWIFGEESFDYFDEFVQDFQKKIEKVGIVFMATAIELKEEEIRTFASQLGEMLGRHIVLNLEVKPGILGGAMMRVENLVFDYSLRSRFQQFQRQWVASLKKSSKLVDMD